MVARLSRSVLRRLVVALCLAACPQWSTRAAEQPEHGATAAESGAAASQAGIRIDGKALTFTNHGVTKHGEAWVFDGKSWLDLSRELAPNVAGTMEIRISASFTATAPDGVLVAHGGDRSGYSVYVKDGRLLFAQCADWTRTVVASEPLGAGEHTLEAVRHADGHLTLQVDDQPVVSAQATVLGANPGDSLQLGADLIKPVGDYDVPNAFRGTIRGLNITSSPRPRPPVQPVRKARPENAAGKPNIITVFIDDMGWSDLSCFGGTHTVTESIDRLATEGIRFTNFYVNSPICSPSRVALTTGQYPHRWRISSYLASRQANIKRGMAQWLDPRAPVLARELSRAGYATGHFGKWHMGGQRDVGDAPLIAEYGFDRSLTNFEGLGPRILPLCDAYNGKPPRRHDLGSARLGRGPIRWEDRSVVTAAFVKDALSFIDEAGAAGRPFYINLWPDDVHSPFFPPDVLRDKTDGSKRALYYAVLDAMDQQLGVLFDRVRNDTRLRGNTLILVASDNGHEQGAGSSDPLRGGKTWMYEGGVRSPLIAWGPGLLASDIAGSVNQTSILCALDVNRSLYTIAGVTLPTDAIPDGEDLASTLLGHEKRSRVAPIFWRRPPDRPGTEKEPNPDLAVREGKWKFYVSYDGSRAQLYDLLADISETRNLAGNHPDIVKRLTEAVHQWNASLPADAGDPRARRLRGAP